MFAEIATHNHFVLQQDRSLVPNSTAPIIDFSVDANPLPLLELLNSSTACFWLKQVSQKKGGDADVSWLRTYHFSGAKVASLPVPEGLTATPSVRLVQLASDFNESSPQAIIRRWREDPAPDLQSMLRQAESTRVAIRAKMIFEQEEQDWEIYRLFGLTEKDQSYRGSAIDALRLGERAFEMVMGHDAGEKDVDSLKWFERHGSRPATSCPDEWPSDYIDRVSERVELIRTDPYIRLLESPEFKRRWELRDWSEELEEAARRAILDILEDPALWQDQSGPVLLSTLQLADKLRFNSAFFELAKVISKLEEPDFVEVIEAVIGGVSVPFVAALRYTLPGREKFDEWQNVYELQRRQDNGENINIPVPPIFSSVGDFQRTEYYRSRGKFDLRKERFLIYPYVRRVGDDTSVLGWAGWSHRDQAVALVRGIMDQQTLGASKDVLVPMVAGLVELEPWLHQWHTDIEPEFGTSAAQAVTSQIEQFLTQLQMTREDLNAWRPPANPRGRKRA